MAEREGTRLSPLMLLGDTLLLVCALAGLAASFLSLYGGGEAAVYAPAAAQALRVIPAGRFALAAALLALVSAAAWSLPRFRGAAAGGLAALWGLALWANGRAALQGAGLTIRAITEIFARRVSWGRVFAYAPGLTQAQEGEAVRRFLLLALAGLALALGWAVVRGRRWWIVALLTLPPLLPGLLADLYPSWPAFLALCACWCAMLLADLCKWAAPDRRGALTLAALPAVWLALAGLTLLLPMEGYTRPGWALRAEEGLRAAGDSLSAFLYRWEGPFGSRAAYTGSPQDADLSSAGPLRYTGRAALRVESDYQGRLYLRGSALGRYEDGRWSDLGREAYQEYLDALEGAGLEDVPSPLLFPAQTGYGMPYTVTVENARASGVYAPYQLLEQDWAQAGVMPARDSYLARKAGLPRYTLSFRLLSDLSYYKPAYAPHPAERYYRDYVHRHYLDVPEELRETLRRRLDEGLQQFYAQVVTSWQPSADELIGNPADIARMVAGALEALCEYDPETPAAPAGTDPVEYFLNGSRRGYCMHFASAAVLMLRELGVPARYASGYTAGVEPGRRTDVPDYAAHAWVEVYVDGYGWYPVEVTPAAAFTWYEREDAQPSPTPSAPEPTPTPTPTPAPAPSQGPDASQAPTAGLPGGNGDGPQGGGMDWTPFIAAGKGLAAAAGALALLWLGQYLPKRRRARRLTGPEPNGAALYAYGCLLRLERWGGEAAPRALELAQKAKFSQHTLTPEELGELRALVDRERARLCASPPGWRRLAALYVWGRPQMGENTGEFPEKPG